MIIIKMEQDKSLLVTRKPILHQFEHKADQLLFLIPPNIDNVDLANANVIARFILLPTPTGPCWTASPPRRSLPGTPPNRTPRTMLMVWL